MAKYWDLDMLMAHADAFAVAERIGIRKKRCGGSTYIECVEGTHTESQINHNQLFRDGCKCYSCGAAHNTYGLVKGYYQNILGTPIDHDDICSLIAETCGNEDMFIIKTDKSEKGKKKKAPFPLTDEELLFIGLAPKAPRARAVVKYSEEKDEECRDACDEGYAKTVPLPPMNMYLLFREDETTFWDIVAGKIKEKIDVAKAGYRAYKEDPDKELVQIFIDTYNKARDLENKFCAQKKLAAS